MWEDGNKASTSRRARSTVTRRGLVRCPFLCSVLSTHLSTSTFPTRMGRSNASRIHSRYLAQGNSLQICVKCWQNFNMKECYCNKSCQPGWAATCRNDLNAYFIYSDEVPFPAGESTWILLHEIGLHTRGETFSHENPRLNPISYFSGPNSIFCS